MGKNRALLTWLVIFLQFSLASSQSITTGCEEPLPNGIPIDPTELMLVIEGEQYLPCTASRYHATDGDYEAALEPVTRHIEMLKEQLELTPAGFIPNEVVNAPFVLEEDDLLMRLQGPEEVFLVLVYARIDYVRARSEAIIALYPVTDR